jgi:hypothetical protein
MGGWMGVNSLLWTVLLNTVCLKLVSLQQLSTSFPDQQLHQPQLQAKSVSRKRLAGVTAGTTAKMMDVSSVEVARLLPGCHLLSLEDQHLATAVTILMQGTTNLILFQSSKYSFGPLRKAPPIHLSSLTSVLTLPMLLTQPLLHS